MMRVSMGIVGLTLLFGCHHSSDSDDPYTPAKVASVQHSLKFHKVILHPIAVDKGVDDPGTAPVDCQYSTATFLGQKKIFASVQQSPAPPDDADTMSVDTTVTSLRIVGGAARFW